MDGKTIDLASISRQYYRGQLMQVLEDQYDGAHGDEGDPQMNFENLKLQILPSIKWTATAPQTEHKGPTRKVRVENMSKEAQVFGNLQTSKESDMYVKVTLSSGMLKGLNKTTRLPLPQEIQSKLGTNIKFDPSKPESGVPDKMNISVTSGHDIPAGAGAATATVSCKEEEYEGRFVCQASLTGKVIFKSQRGESTTTPISEIVRNIQNHHNYGVIIQDQEVIWTMEGSCALCWDFEQTVKWESS